ncbi:hypothetical protein AMJ82_04865 [candidate division TA06 bacterium SM23_40]|uniref:Right handed beta helix domain-containing protein n=1 Tax=candidate division TA06 bacterium SM23_40 TaxID=1703774 RepID=A0A0S8GA74_UNCT6|nr:MAG: hypothetical protein AMJ82_04865 [candidate division TA06 bacterium SM23_40]
MHLFLCHYRWEYHQRECGRLGTCYDHGSPTIVGNTIVGNGASHDGGGIHASSYSTPTIESNVIAENWAHRGAGIKCFDHSPAAIVSNMIMRNSASFGGGINCEECSPIIRGNTIGENTAQDAGGIYCFVRSSPTIVGNTIVGNTSSWKGGGIKCRYHSCPVITGNTITRNVADEGGAIYATYCSSPAVLNSILWADSADVGPEIYLEHYYWSVSAIRVDYSDVSGGSLGVYVAPGCTLNWGEGNIDADPMFVTGGRNDCRLLWGSPCVDAGHLDSLDPDGTRRDMGAYFFDQAKTLVAYASPEVHTLHPGQTVQMLCTLVNCHGDPQPARGIVELTLPDGEPWPGNPLEGPGYGVMPPGFNWQYVREYTLPGPWPLGTTGLTWKVGMPGNLFDSERILFTVAEP